MKNLISLSEAVEELELPGHGTAEVHVSAEGNYDGSRGMLLLTLSSGIRPLVDADTCLRPAWLPNPQLLQEHVSVEEATALAREIFSHWAEKVRRAIPAHAHPVL